MRDFLGRPFEAGLYVAYGGGGNSSGNYGMLLARIVNVGDTSTRIVRLKASYPQHTKESCVIKKTHANVTSGGRYILVDPPRRVREMFEKAVAGELNKDEIQVVAQWLHDGTLP